MDFSLSPVQEQWRDRMADFLQREVYPAEAVARREVAELDAEHRWPRPAVMSRLADEARAAGLWNLGLPAPYGSGLSHLDLAPVVELSGRSPHLAPEAINANSPDVGNMELLLRHGTPERQERWLAPLAAGEIRSSFAMTEPDVASSDAGNISTSIEVDEQTQEVVYSGAVNLGIAAATPRGLVVPTIKGADSMSAVDLAGAIGSVTATAREGRTQPQEMTGGTFTITNVGVFGVDAGTPILNPGETGILAIGAVRRQPWEYRGEVALRHVMTLALTFDHRVVDGAEGSRFLADVGAILADPGMTLTML